MKYLWMALWVVACSGNGKVKVDPKLVCAQLKEAAATTWATCRGVSVETAALLFEREFHCERYLLLAAEKRVEAEKEQADKCLAAARDNCLTLDGALSPEGSCSLAFTPNSRAGDDCVTLEECFDRRCVVASELDCSGVCVAPRQIGQPCVTSDDCVSTGYCADTGKCAAYPGVGQNCFNGLCAPGTACDGARCRALPFENQPCLQGNCATPLVCLTVADAPTCVSPYAVTNDMQCKVSCGAIARCQGATDTQLGTCQVLAAAGEACSPALPCRSGLHCASAVCVPDTAAPAIGETCGRDPPACEASTCDTTTSTCALIGLSSGCFIH